MPDSGIDAVVELQMCKTISTLTLTFIKFFGKGFTLYCIMWLMLPPARAQFPPFFGVFSQIFLLPTHFYWQLCQELFGKSKAFYHLRLMSLTFVLSSFWYNSTCLKIVIPDLGRPGFLPFLFLNVICGFHLFVNPLCYIDESTFSRVFLTCLVSMLWRIFPH